MAKEKKMPEKKKAVEKKKVLLRFHEEQTSPTLEIGHGEYTRKFDAKEQPFECEPEEAELLKRTGYFVDESAAAKAEAGEKSNTATS